MASPRNACYIDQDAKPDGSLVCPRCRQATVYPSFPYGEPMCDACDWSASDEAAK
jgi:uncharacterized protein (DUF983 family)